MPTPIAHAPAPPFEQHDQWVAHLKTVAQQPLTLCPHFPDIARRFEAWWSQELLDRPIFLGSVNANPARPINKRLDLLDDPDAWIRAKCADVAQMHRVGDQPPTLRVDFGPVLLSSMFAQQVDIVSDSTWSHPMIEDDWSNLPDFVITDSTRWYRTLQERLAQASEAAAGHFLVKTPDLGGSADVLLNLRGSDMLCMDVIDQPQQIIDAQERIYPAWRQAFALLYDTTASHGAGLVHWLDIWSDSPYLVPACDFNYMISPADFERTCLPDIARQTATVGRAVFHLDGPGAARHADALCRVPGLEAIQFTPGDASPSALQWVEMFKRIQEAGRSLFIACPHDEVLALCDALDPRGLGMFLSDSPPAQTLDAVYDALCKKFGCER